MNLFTICDLPMPFREGFFLGLSLIVAIGAQNLFILRQGVIGKHLGLVASISSICDFAMILFGVLGAGSVIASFPTLKLFFVILGLAFLLYYGIRAWIQAFSGRSSQTLQSSGESFSSRKKVVLAAIGFSLLNPHAFLDTVILMGGLSAQYGIFSDRLAFATGAGVASMLWFFSLAYGSKLLAPVFRKPTAATFLDIFIGIIMFSIAWSLAKREFFC